MTDFQYFTIAFCLIMLAIMLVVAGLFHIGGAL